MKSKNLLIFFTNFHCDFAYQHEKLLFIPSRMEFSTHLTKRVNVSCSFSSKASPIKSLLKKLRRTRKNAHRIFPTIHTQIIPCGRLRQYHFLLLIQFCAHATTVRVGVAHFYIFFVYNFFSIQFTMCIKIKL